MATVPEVARRQYVARQRRVGLFVRDVLAVPVGQRRHRMGQDLTHLPVVDRAPEHAGEGTEEGEEQEQEKRQDQRQCLELARPLRPFQAALERHLGRVSAPVKNAASWSLHDLTRSKERREERHRRSVSPLPSPADRTPATRPIGREFDVANVISLPTC